MRAKFVLILVSIVSLLLICGCDSVQNESAEQADTTDADQNVVVPDDENSVDEKIAAAQNASALEENAGEIDSKVLDFELPLYSGETFSSDQLQGKVTMLIFWFPT